MKIIHCNCSCIFMIFIFLIHTVYLCVCTFCLFWSPTAPFISLNHFCHTLGLIYFIHANFMYHCFFRINTCTPSLITHFNLALLSSLAFLTFCGVTLVFVIGLMTFVTLWGSSTLSVLILHIAASSESTLVSPPSSLTSILTFHLH